jgi:DNA-binding transcriptional LysR family regulator
LFNDRLYFIAGIKHRLAARRKVDLADLINEQWSLPPSGSVPRSLIDDAFRVAHVMPPQTAISTFAIQVHISLLAAGRFLAVLPASMLSIKAPPR